MLIRLCHDNINTQEQILSKKKNLGRAILKNIQNRKIFYCDMTKAGSTVFNSIY